MISPWLFNNGIKIALIVGCFWIIGTAYQVQPDDRGFGTHEQLGLEPCSYYEAYGHPCPTCGMTTSFAHTVRFQLPDAIAANPAGTVLCFICLILPGVLVHSMVTGQPIARLFVGRVSGYWMVIAVVLVAASWIYKILALV